MDEGFISIYTISFESRKVPYCTAACLASRVIVVHLYHRHHLFFFSFPHQLHHEQSIDDEDANYPYTSRMHIFRMSVPNHIGIASKVTVVLRLSCLSFDRDVARKMWLG